MDESVLLGYKPRIILTTLHPGLSIAYIISMYIINIHAYIHISCSCFFAGCVANSSLPSFTESAPNLEQMTRQEI